MLCTTQIAKNESSSLKRVAAIFNLRYKDYYPRNCRVKNNQPRSISSNNLSGNTHYNLDLSYVLSRINSVCQSLSYGIMKNVGNANTSYNFEYIVRFRL